MSFRDAPLAQARNPSTGKNRIAMDSGLATLSRPGMTKEIVLTTG
jgi:hypothetical protein